MGRSQVEYNRKHGRGRGRGGRGRGVSSSSSSNNSGSSNASLPRHLQPTAVSKAKKTQQQQHQQDTTTSGSSLSPVPSYLSPTSSSAGKSKPASPKSINSNNRRAALSSPSQSPSTIEQRKRPIRGKDSPAQSSRTTTTTTTTSGLALPPLTTTTTGTTTTAQQQFTRTFSKKDPPGDPLPDSPEQQQRPVNSRGDTIASSSPLSSPSQPRQTSLSPSSSALLLYQTHSHVVIPKPHDTPILQVNLQADALAKALELSLPWYERLRLDTHVALAIDPDRDVPKSKAQSTRMTYVSQQHNKNPDDMDAAVEELLAGLEHTDTLVELETVDEETTVSSDKKRNLHNNHRHTQSKQYSGTIANAQQPSSAMNDSVAGSSSSSTVCSRTVDGGETKLMQRARRYKQQHSNPRSHGTSQDPVASLSRKLPDPPAHHHGTTSHSNNNNNAPQQPPPPLATPHHEWDDIAPAMSDLTLPTALNSSDNKPSSAVRAAATTGLGAITRVLPPEENDDDDDDMDQWLDSALKSVDEADNDKDVQRPVPQKGKEKRHNRESEKKQHREAGINLEAFAEDDEDNMEDWLESQIS